MLSIQRVYCTLYTYLQVIGSILSSLQQINQVLNEKIESQAKFRSSHMVGKQSCAVQTNPSDLMKKTTNNSTQTDDKSPSASPIVSKPGGVSVMKKTSKPSNSAKEDTHLLATVRGMRVDLAIKEKALQRLTREVDECRKTIRKLQKDNDSEFPIPPMNSVLWKAIDYIFNLL